MTLLILDLFAVAAAFSASVLWWRASRQTLRRVSRTEELDAADINRIVVAINRTQVLNRQAALATAAASLLAALHFTMMIATR